MSIATRELPMYHGVRCASTLKPATQIFNNETFCRWKKITNSALIYRRRVICRTRPAADEKLTIS